MADEAEIRNAIRRAVAQEGVLLYDGPRRSALIEECTRQVVALASPAPAAGPSLTVQLDGGREAKVSLPGKVTPKECDDIRTTVSCWLTSVQARWPAALSRPAAAEEKNDD